MFVSRLSVNEFVLSEALEVRGSVAGTVVYHAGETEFPEASRLLKGPTNRRAKIIHQAFSRLGANAARLDADGIIGVTLLERRLDQQFSEYTVSGTAVTGCARNADNRPAVCALSAQEYALLLAGGYRPVGVAIGVSIYFQALHQRVQAEVEKKVNTERSDFTRGLYTARQKAFTSLHQEADRLQAEGILGINVHVRRILKRVSRQSLGMLIEMTAVGTAVVGCTGTSLQASPVMPLNV